jgi:hypothetical protein
MRVIGYILVAIESKNIFLKGIKFKSKQILKNFIVSANRCPVKRASLELIVFDKWILFFCYLHNLLVRDLACPPD